MPTVVAVLLGVESHRGLLSWCRSQQPTDRQAGGPQPVSRGLKRTADAARLGPNALACSIGAIENMEPQRKIVTRDNSSSSKPLRMGDYVWALGGFTSDGRALIEYKDTQFYVPSDLLADTPVPPSMEKLKKLDPCFARAENIAHQIHIDHAHFFRILECEHGNLFLEDTKTGILWSKRLIFIGHIARNQEAYLNFWEHHYRLSTDHIHLLGIGI